MRFPFILSLAFASLTFTSPVSAMGQAAKVFETSSSAGIWDHGGEFYLRLDLSELGDLKNQTFLWAGFHQTKLGVFQGEVVADQFGKNEKRFPARAKLMEATETATYYRIEILGTDGEVIKEVFLKGPVRHVDSNIVSE